MSTPTQVRRPWRATARTLFQQFLGYLLAAGVVLPLVLTIVQEELGDVIPPRAMGWIVVVVGIAVALSAIATRVMAIPQVEAFLRRHRLLSGLAAEPRPKGSAGPGEGGRVDAAYLVVVVILVLVLFALVGVI